MNHKQLIEKIMQKKEFFELPVKEVEKVFSKFEKRQVSSEEKIRLTRDLLRKIYFSFGSKKLLNPKIVEKKTIKEILNKHISTKERLSYYEELYEKLFSDLEGQGANISVIDLGAGINGLSYNYFKSDTKYIAVEAIGQLVELMNVYFKREKISHKAKAFHESLFEIEKIKSLINKEKGKKIVFLFKTLDSLEMIERDYSKKLLQEIVPLVNKVVLSFATKSLIKKTKFRAKRTWLLNFIEENFKVLDDFEISGERYVVFNKLKKK